MMYCENCEVDIFGGSICHFCGNILVKKTKNETPKVVHVSSQAIMGRKKSLRVDSAQSLGGRIFRLILEIALFCFLFYFISLAIAHTINWITSEMAMNPESEPDAINIQGNGFKYFRYAGLAIVTILTIMFRFQPGK